jgi:hypothetical protein
MGIRVLRRKLGEGNCVGEGLGVVGWTCVGHFLLAYLESR